MSIPVQPMTPLLEALIESFNDVRRERDRYRKALVAIADQESGQWGVLAYRALMGEDVT